MGAQPAPRRSAREKRRTTRRQISQSIIVITITAVFAMFITMSLGTLNATPEQAAAIAKIRTDMHAAMAPAHDAEKAVLLALADGVAANNIDQPKVDAAFARLTAAVANVHDAVADSLGALHATLTPPQRAALVDKVEAHFEVWNHANAPDETPTRDAHGGASRQAGQAARPVCPAGRDDSCFIQTHGPRRAPATPRRRSTSLSSFPAGCMLVGERMEHSYLRLRQIALVARALEPIERQLTSVLATDVCFRDPGVGRYGLHNALWALGGTFLEVVSPIRDNTAAGRYLDRRGGDGGYMCIVDCDDLDVRRAHLAALGTRIVEDVRAGDAALWSEAIHLHPKDTGGCLLSIDRHSGGTDTMGGYRWAGTDWQSKARRDVVISGAVMQCDDPAATARRWARLLRRTASASAGGGYELRLDNAVARFVPLADDRGEGLACVVLSCAEPASMFAAATAIGASVGSSWIELCGVRFVIEHRTA